MRVHHVAVLVRDLDRAERFYVDVLGLDVVRRWTDDAGAPRSVWVSLGPDAFLAIERAAAAEPPLDVSADRSGWHCIALAISPDARQTWRARLANAGVPITRESPHTLYFRDPDDNLVALSHWPTD